MSQSQTKGNCSPMEGHAAQRQVIAQRACPCNRMEMRAAQQREREGQLEQQMHPCMHSGAHSGNLIRNPQQRVAMYAARILQNGPNECGQHPYLNACLKHSC